MATLREIICASTATTLREYMCVETGNGSITINSEIVMIEEEAPLSLSELNTDIIIINDEQADNVVELEEVTDIILDRGDEINVNVY